MEQTNAFFLEAVKAMEDLYGRGRADEPRHFGRG